MSHTQKFVTVISSVLAFLGLVVPSFAQDIDLETIFKNVCNKYEMVLHQSVGDYLATLPDGTTFSFDTTGAEEIYPQLEDSYSDYRRPWALAEEAIMAQVPVSLTISNDGLNERFFWNLPQYEKGYRDEATQSGTLLSMAYYGDERRACEATAPSQEHRPAAERELKLNRITMAGNCNIYFAAYAGDVQSFANFAGGSKLIVASVDGLETQAMEFNAVDVVNDAADLNEVIKAHEHVSITAFWTENEGEFIGSLEYSNGVITRMVMPQITRVPVTLILYPDVRGSNRTAGVIQIEGDYAYQLDTCWNPNN